MKKILIIFLVILATLAEAQSSHQFTKQDSLDTKMIESLPDVNVPPITCSNGQDNYPDSMNIRGTFIASSIVTYCGAIVGRVATPMLVSLTLKPESYNQDTLYFLVVCPSRIDSEYIGKSFYAIVKKYMKKDENKFGVHSMNIFQSNGVPFYWRESSELHFIK
jgi:hypothetical protein